MENETIGYGINSTIHAEFTNYTYPNPEPDKYVEISEFIYTNFCPVITVLGIIFNLITFVSLLRPPMNSFSVSVYIAAYCVSSILTCVFIIGPDWLFHTVEYRHFNSISDLNCRIWSFLTSLISFSGFWFITGAVVDRVIVLWVPCKAQTLCTVFMAKNSVVFILVGLTAVSIHAMWMFTHSADGGGSCHLLLEHFSLLWMWASAFLLGCLPLMLLFIFGNMMIIRLCLKHQGRQIPEMSKNEMDLTYSVLILSLITVVFAMPMNIMHILSMLYIHDIDMHRSLQLQSEFATYISWVCYVFVFFVLICRCNAFRDALKDIFIDCSACLSRDNSNIELQLMKGEYDQVPSTSTRV